MSVDDQDITDARLFRLWIKLAETAPGYVANELTFCMTEDDYRKALLKMAREMRINLP